MGRKRSAQGQPAVYRALRLRNRHADRVERDQSFEQLDRRRHLQRGRTMRMVGGVQRTIGALIEREVGPKRRVGRRRVAKTKIPGIEAEIQTLLRSIGQVEAVANALRFAHATSL
jgi:hypothetical protein